MGDWQTSPASGLEAAIAEFKAALPGWWFTVGECQVSADASCAPTRESMDIDLIPLNALFDGGFHADLPQPDTMANALRTVMREALAALRDRDGAGTAMTEGHGALSPAKLGLKASPDTTNPLK